MVVEEIKSVAVSGIRGAVRPMFLNIDQSNRKKAEEGKEDKGKIREAQMKAKRKS